MHRQNTTLTISKATASGTPSRITPSNVMQTRRRMTQNYLVIWVDGNIDSNNHDCQNTLELLRTVVSDVNICTTSEQCVQFLNDLDDGKAFVISSGALGQHLVHNIHSLAQVDAIYIFCGNKTIHEQWAKEWTKIRGVFTSMNPICESLKKVARHCDHDSIPMSFVSKQTMTAEDGSQEQNLDQLQPSYMYSVLFKDIILEINEDDNKYMEALVVYCRDQGVSQRQLKYFQDNYHQKSAIWWYTEEIFLYSMLNKALRSLDMEAMVKMGFFIRNLHRQLEQLHREQSSVYGKKFVVYRGQGLTQEDFQQLVDTKGGLLAFNSFLSTSKEREVAVQFVQSAISKSEDIVGVIFIMTIDQSKISTSTTPFALIDDYSAMPSEQEILFTMHTVFRVNEIKQTAKYSRVWEVQLNITGDNDPQLAGLTQRIKYELCGSTGWHRLGHLMLKVAHFEQANELYNELLRNASSDTDRAFIYNMLGMLKNDQHEYQEAATFYEKSLEIYEKTLPSNHPDLASSYNSIGSVYNNMGEYSKALEFYEKSNKIIEISLPLNYPDLAASYNNLGSTYNNMGDYSKALEFYNKSIKIKEISLPPNHPDLAASYNNIGSAYNDMSDYTKALEFYSKSRKIYEKVLPPNHPNLAVSYWSIGEIYSTIGEYSKSLSFLEKALAIFRNSSSSTHPDIESVMNSIEYVKKKL